ncbi:putative peptide maturation dehydrogenase [Xanthomonas translucens]|uniref:putative peptide maturation dehydrogenase n=1 Tax=Xanthomonas campestris pv. translucens TaxID=343 RepID=UPI00071E6D24|nr:putative peptide maturation dehydrogenase [Xanthomonas translucens]
MHVRRCFHLFLEPREVSRFDMASLLAGGNGLRRERQWVALAPHLEQELEVDALERELLGALSAGDWTDTQALPSHCTAAGARLLEVGLLLSNADDAPGGFAERDATMREAYWWGPAVLAHRFGRCQGSDSVVAMEANGLTTAAGLCEKLGPPPAEVGERGAATARLPLPRARADDFDALLARRATCRNFDTARPLPLVAFAQLMQRVFAARVRVEADGVAAFLKKNAPSGGGLHATEAYLIVQRVHGLAPGVYHYHPVDHALEPLPAPDIALDVLARTAVAGQHWFADAPVLVVMAPRYARMYWKYRHHPKAYRALLLDIGHLSQLLYLCATQAQWGAFVTSAINEVDIEQAFGMDPLREGPLVVCGFGWRAPALTTAEFDPAGAVWQASVSRSP